MRSLNDIINESLLDDDDDLMDKGAKATERRQVWEDLTSTYGEILLGSTRGIVTIDNIGLDTRGRIIFKNWPGYEIEFYLGSIDTFPDSVMKHGFGELPPEITSVCITSARGKMSQIPFLGNYRGVKIKFNDCSLELDKFPKFSMIDFIGTYFRNVQYVPKRIPKGCTITFDSNSQANLFAAWSKFFFKGTYPQWDCHGKQKIVM